MEEIEKKEAPVVEIIVNEPETPEETETTSDTPVTETETTVAEITE